MGAGHRHIFNSINIDILVFSDDFGYDSQDNEEMKTNADIKRQGQSLMDQKNKKRTRGRRKK